MQRDKPITTRRGDPLCADCRGTGKDLGSDGSDGMEIRDAEPNTKCRTCKGTGEGK